MKLLPSVNNSPDICHYSIVAGSVHWVRICLPFLIETQRASFLRGGLQIQVWAASPTLRCLRNVKSLSADQWERKPVFMSCSSTGEWIPGICHLPSMFLNPQSEEERTMTRCLTDSRTCRSQSWRAFSSHPAAKCDEQSKSGAYKQVFITGPTWQQVHM